MASISQKPNGRRLIQFVGADGKRGTIHLGKVSKRQAEAIKIRVEQLAAAAIGGHPPDVDTQRWVKSIGDDLHRKLAKAGLVPSRTDSSKALGPFLDAYFTARKDVSPHTLTVWGHTRRNLLEYFGAGKLLQEITEADAEDWRRWLIPQLADTTIRKRSGFAKQFFQYAVKARLIERNPFADLKSAAQSNPTRKFYVTREMTEKLIDASPDNQWRVIIALCRYAGLRCPSEVVLLRWSDIDWHAERMTVTSPKTKHHVGKGSRVVPLYHELLPHLSEAFELAEDGSEFVITRYRDQSQNLRTTFLKIIRRAGLTPWPKLFVNLRASAATDLVEQFPAHVANAWMGHCESIAREHYRQVTDEHFAKASAANAPHRFSLPVPKLGTDEHFAKASAANALQNALQQAPETGCNELQSSFDESEKPPFCGGLPLVATPCHVTSWRIGDSNPPSVSSLKPENSPPRAAEGAAVDASLAAIIECWPKLPEAERQRIADDVRTTAAAHARSGDQTT